MEFLAEVENIRIDKYLASNTEYSREYISKLIDAGFVTVNGKVCKASMRIKLNDKIIINDELKKEVKFEAEEIPLDIIYEDEYLMIINKQSGLVVHPGSGNKSHTLVNALMYHTEELSDSSGCDRAGIVHRLDKDTSGLMLVAKTNKVHEILSEYFKNKKVKREYLALIHGTFPSSTAKIDAPIGRSKKDFRMMEVRPDGKNAVTNLKVEKYYKKYTLVRLSLETGRTHQIRCHLSYIGYPIVNDPVYSNDDCTSFGQYLHSCSIDFEHPITGEKIHFDSELPKEFNDFLSTLDAK